MPATNDAGRRVRRMLKRVPGLMAVRELGQRGRLALNRARGDDLRWRFGTRWRSAEPDADLTWGLELTGDAFVRKAADRGAFGPGRVILEIGPGYGRLLRSCLSLELPFERYLALDLSESNVSHLRGEFAGDGGDGRVEVVQGNVETVDLDGPIDTVLSSLTLKHLYPSFEAALGNIQPHLSDGGLVIFDLIEGRKPHALVERDNVTYIRKYTRDEVTEILDRVGLELVAFDEVEHAPDFTRLLVVAANPA